MPRRPRLAGATALLACCIAAAGCSGKGATGAGPVASSSPTAASDAPSGGARTATSGPSSTGSPAPGASSKPTAGPGSPTPPSTIAGGRTVTPRPSSSRTAPAAGGFWVEVALPAPITESDAAHIASFREALARVRRAVPRLTGVAVFLRPDTQPADWTALLDAARAQRLTLRVGFASTVTESGGAESGYRPVRSSSGDWDLGPLGRFLACRSCAGHPALTGVILVDEPWHPTKRPSYPTSDLQDLYATARALAAPARPPLHLQFSRELWKHEGGDRTTWTNGMADGVQISALEFQDRSYQRQTLLDNHLASRRIVQAATPGRLLLSSVQVMGAKVGPNPGYYFPTASELEAMLTDIVRSDLERAHRLDGIMLQSWDSESVSRRSTQVTLGDAVLPGQPAEQVSAAKAALSVLNRWLASR